MNHLPLAGVATLLLAAAGSAQNPLGTFTNTGTTWSTRGAAATPNTNPCVLFVRHDVENYIGLTNGATPAVHEILGGNFVVQDADLSTQDSFNLLVYGADPLVPDFPDVSAPLGITGNFGLPIGTGGSAYNASINFTTPILAPAADDFYIGLQFNTAWTILNGQVTDGLSTWEIQSQAPTAPAAGQSWDEPGGRISTVAPEDTFAGFYCATPATGPLYPVQTQFKIQPIIPISGGVACTVTNQPHHVESTATSAAGFTVQVPGAGTSSMFSALHPDAASPSANPGRVDQIGQIFENGSIAAGSPVFFLIDIGGFAPPPLQLPGSNFVPGSTGISCLDISKMQSLGFSTLNSNGYASFLTTFPAAARVLLPGIDWMQQAVAVDLVTNTLHATACTRQKT